MGATWGNKIKVSIFGESHGRAVGINIDGLPSGFILDEEKILFEMARRAPGKNNLSTARKEPDMPEILSGYFNGRTTGTPLSAVIYNQDTRSKDYDKTKDYLRPGHADYSGMIKYDGYNDYRGGGHFSGRLTAPLVFAGAICKQILESKGIKIVSHISSIKEIKDEDFNSLNFNEYIENLKNEEIPLNNKGLEDKIRHEILQAKYNGDSVGGVIECMVYGLKAGVGDPFFDSVESTLAHLMFSVPAVKGIEFGLGFKMTEIFGSEANDEYYLDNENIKTRSNNNGGVLGGITNGMPVTFKVAIKPTASIAKIQNTVDINKKEEVSFRVEGRHDPCIVLRAIPVIEAVTAIGILNLIGENYA